MSSPIAVQNEQGPKLTTATRIGLREAGVTESWLEREIEKNPAMLGLGDVTVIDRQRRQEKAGRLDLLMEDDSGDERYEVELMLGTTDESHLIRTVEYWDIDIAPLRNGRSFVKRNLAVAALPRKAAIAGHDQALRRDKLQRFANLASHVLRPIGLQRTMADCSDGRTARARTARVICAGGGSDVAG